MDTFKENLEEFTGKNQEKRAAEIMEKLTKISDPDELIELRKEATTLNRMDNFGLINSIEGRMFEVYKNVVPNTSEPKRLIKLWQNISFTKVELGKIIEKRLEEVFSEISDPDRLTKLWKNTTKGSEPRKIIEKRIEEVYAKISSIKQLGKSWKELEGIEARKIIWKRMEEVYKDILPKTSDLDLLLEFWEYTPMIDPLNELFNERLLDVCIEKLPMISNPRKLMKLWEISDDETLLTMVENRMYEVYKRTLPTIFNPDRLLELWECTSDKSDSAKIIALRSTEIVSMIRKTSIPDWFKEMVSGKKEIPEFMEDDVKKKAKEIYEQIYC